MAQFLIWSNEHRRWWRGAAGYTEFIEEAGRYGRVEAERIVAEATLQGQLTVRREDPYTGREYSQLSEVVVLAPEDIPDPATGLPPHPFEPARRPNPDASVGPIDLPQCGHLHLFNETLGTVCGHPSDHPVHTGTPVAVAS